jgi:hypothetical protein
MVRLKKDYTNYLNNKLNTVNRSNQKMLEINNKKSLLSNKVLPNYSLTDGYKMIPLTGEDKIQSQLISGYERTSDIEYDNNYENKKIFNSNDYQNVLQDIDLNPTSINGEGIFDGIVNIAKSILPNILPTISSFIGNVIKNKDTIKDVINTASDIKDIIKPVKEYNTNDEINKLLRDGIITADQYVQILNNTKTSNVKPTTPKKTGGRVYNKKCNIKPIKDYQEALITPIETN